MTRRLYFLVPGVESGHAVVDELEQSGIPERHIHIIGSARYDLGNLPKASALQKSEIAYGLEWGVFLGGLAGLIGAWLVINAPPPGVVLAKGNGLYAILGLAGAIVGAGVSAMVAKGVPSHKLRAFERAINSGQLLVMVDVPRHDVNATKDMIIKHHPEAQIGVTQTRGSRHQPPPR